MRHAPPPDKKKLEHDFVFACVWAFGGAMFQDKVSDYRKQFSAWWTAEWKAVPFPDKGLVFDYRVRVDDDGAVCMAPWEDAVAPFTYSPAETFGNMFVDTVETTRMKYFLRSLVANRHYCMFVGNTGTSKTAIMMSMLRGMDAETMSSYVINMNSFSDAPSLQPTLEAPLEKKSGVRFGPPGAKSMVYFIDDMNMPFVDKYDTQSAIEIVRQYVDYGGWYDKVKIVLKDIVACQLVGAMNPTAGSFQITPRMQRHFVTFGIVVRARSVSRCCRSRACAAWRVTLANAASHVQMPGPEIVRSIYHQLIHGHLQDFEPDVARLSGKLTDATIELHKAVMDAFLPSSVKFHYQFNLREMSNITQARSQDPCSLEGSAARGVSGRTPVFAVLFAWLHTQCAPRVAADAAARVQGLLRMRKDTFKTSTKAVRLWAHECERVFRDRLVCDADLERYDAMQTASLRAAFKEEDLAAVQAAPNLFTAFMDTSTDDTPVFNQVRVWGATHVGPHEPASAQRAAVRRGAGCRWRATTR